MNRKQEFPINKYSIDERHPSHKPVSAAGEAVVAYNGAYRYRDVVNTGLRGSPPTPGDELLDGVRLTLDLDRDAAIGLIAGKPGDAEPLGLPPCRLPVIDSLDNTLDPNGEMSSIAHIRNLLHWQAHPSGLPLRSIIGPSLTGAGCHCLTPRRALKYAFQVE